MTGNVVFHYQLLKVWKTHQVIRLFEHAMKVKERVSER